MTERKDVSSRVDPMGDGSDSPTAGQNTLTPATVTPASPLPWAIDDGADILDAEGGSVNDSWAEWSEDAPFIVTACNSHHLLVGLLRSIRDDRSAYQWHTAIDNTLALIARAESR